MTTKAALLTVDLTGYQHKVEDIARRGKSVIAVMQQEKYPLARIQQERRALERETLDFRMETIRVFSEKLQAIEKSIGL